MTTPTPTAQQLVDEFKKSGEFDRLRRELLAQFQHSDELAPLTHRVHDIAQARLREDPRLLQMPHDAVHRELVGEIDRYPLVERAVAEAPLVCDASCSAAVRTAVRRILGELRGEGRVGVSGKGGAEGDGGAEGVGEDNGEGEGKDEGEGDGEGAGEGAGEGSAEGVSEGDGEGKGVGEGPSSEEGTGENVEEPPP